MKKRLTTAIAILIMLSIVALAAQDSDEAEKRADAIRAALEKIEDVNEQLEQLDTDLPTLQAASDEIATRTDLVAKRGKALVVGFAELKERDDQYGDDVDAHNARCPSESEDAGLVASCNKEKAGLDTTQQALLNDVKQWGLDKNALAKDAGDLFDETAENKRQLEHNFFSRGVLEGAQRRLQGELGRLEKEVRVCAELLEGPVSCERIKHECGNVQFDGADKDLEDSLGEPCN